MKYAGQKYGNSNNCNTFSCWIMMNANQLLLMSIKQLILFLITKIKTMSKSLKSSGHIVFKITMFCNTVVRLFGSAEYSIANLKKDADLPKK